MVKRTKTNKKRKSEQKPAEIVSSKEQRDEKKKGHALTRSQFLSKLVYDSNVVPFLLGPMNLQRKLELIRGTLINSLRKFPFGKTTPLLQESLGAAFVGVADSGVTSLFPAPARGRPRKRPAPMAPTATPAISNVSSLNILFIHFVRYCIRPSLRSQARWLCLCNGILDRCVRASGFQLTLFLTLCCWRGEHRRRLHFLCTG
jgi:hypothetical protein